MLYTCADIYIYIYIHLELGLSVGELDIGDSHEESAPQQSDLHEGQAPGGNGFQPVSHFARDRMCVRVSGQAAPAGAGGFLR